MAEVLGGLAGSVQGTLTGMLNKGNSFIDKWFPPERRAQLWAKFQKFMHEKPMLASFLLSHIAISGIPLGLFILMTISVGVFALLAALLIGLLGALLFIVAAVAFALVILLPVLFFTTLVATFIWLWGTGTYYILKHFNQKEIPGIHKPLLSGLGGDDKKSSGDDLDAINGDKKPQPQPARSANQTNGHHNGKAGGPPKLGTPKKAHNQANGDVTKQVTDGVGKATGADVGGGVDGLKKKVDVDGVTKNLGDVGNVTDKAHVGKLSKQLPGGLLG